MDGMPSAAQLLTYTDKLAALFKASSGVFGLEMPLVRANSLASLASSAQSAIMGDGSTELR